MVLMFLTGIIAVALLAPLLFLHGKSLRKPPCIGGWIPWFGAAFKLGKSPMEFIENARIKYGPVFTISAMGKRMTFITEAEEGIHLFAEAPELSFVDAVQKTICRAVSLPKDIYVGNHEKVSNILRVALGPPKVQKFTGQLTEGFQEQLEQLGPHGTMDLYELIIYHICPSTVNVLLQKGLLPSDKKKIREFYQHFETYESSFNKVSQIPVFLLRNWSQSRSWLLNFFLEHFPLKQTYASSKDDPTALFQSVFDILQMESNEQYFPKYRLLLLWASLVNIIPLTFWTVGFILSHPKVHKDIVEDISSVFGTAGKDKIEISEDDLKKLFRVKQCIMEAIRLRSSTLIFRKVLKPLNVLDYTVPAGDLLVLSPFLTHRDPNNFHEPELFAPERWEKSDLEMHTCMDNFLGFGVGRYKCPARWYSLLEMQIFITLLFYKYDCRLLDPLPNMNSATMLGVPKPEGQCRIEFKLRK